ncbi:MAG: glycosyltransferase family 4 protein [Cytophagales bacterium]|nr:glycosyltransferase family 4 protein [Cytophagales bacterium]
MKVLFLCPYPEKEAPSQRFRYEQYLKFLPSVGIDYVQKSFLDEETWTILYKKGNKAKKIIGILKGFLRRFFLLFTLSSYDYVFIHREATPIGPPWVEWCIAKLWRKRIIYDFDDAIWLSNTSAVNKIVAGIKWHHKVRQISKWSYKVSCGNEYLCDYALQFNQNTIYNPTTIDTENLHKEVKNQHTNHFVLGWTGTHSTMKYLDDLVPVLQKLQEKYDFTFLVISNQDPKLPLKKFQYVQWKKETELQDLLRMNVGVMPLTDDKWAKGKCGFKGLQYLALGIPALVSSVGVNTQIVQDGKNGFLCDSPKEWEEAIEKLVKDTQLSIDMGKEGRRTVVENYSVLSNQQNFIELFS